MGMTDAEREARVRRHLAGQSLELRTTQAEWPDYDTLGLYSIFDTHANDFVAKGISTLDALEEYVFSPPRRS
jgi:hypothetical protein